MRCFLIPAKSVELHTKKSRLRLLFVLFNTKEMFSDILQMVAGIKLQEYIQYFEKANVEVNSKLFSQLSVIYGAISMCVFMHTTMHSYIEMVEVHPYNASDLLLKILKGWKYLSIVVIMIFMIIYIGPQLEVDDFYLANKLNKRDFRYVEWKKFLENDLKFSASRVGHYTQCRDIDYSDECRQFDYTCRFNRCRRQFEIPCECVKKQCYSLDCKKAEKDNLKRIECVSERRDKGLQDCGMVYTAPSSTDTITLNKWGHVTGGFFPIANISKPSIEKRAGYVFRHKTCRFCSIRSFDSLKRFGMIKISAYQDALTSRAKCMHQDNESYTDGAFHGFQDESVCGRVLNTQYIGPNLDGATFSIVRLWHNLLAFSAGYLIVFYTLSSCAMQIWVCLPYKYQEKTFCCCKERCGCCKECRKIQHGNQIQQFSRRRSSIVQNTSFMTVIVPPNSNGKNILVNNIVVKIPQTAKAGDRITLAVKGNSILI